MARSVHIVTSTLPDSKSSPPRPDHPPSDGSVSTSGRPLSHPAITPFLIIPDGPERKMLVISRKAEEFLQIGDDIVIKVIKCSNGSVKIGIDAPGDLRVLRGELQELPKSFPKPLGKRVLTLRTETKEAEAMAEVL